MLREIVWYIEGGTEFIEGPGGGTGTISTETGL
jgi:hypothetical protein